LSSIREKVLERLQLDFPALTEEKMAPLISENLFSPFKMELPGGLLEQAQEFVQVCYAIRNKPEYQRLLEPEIEQHGLKDPGNRAIAMSYDFHVSDNGELKLIEINTNASFLALGHWMYLAHELPSPISDFSPKEIGENIVTELKLFGRSTTSPRIAILDEKPKEQRLYAEFLLYQELLKSQGFQTEICDISEIQKNLDLIYNRYTDFYLEEERSKDLRLLFLNKDVCFSPQPFEYLLLADKQRMIDLRTENFVAQLNLSPEDKKTLWRHLPEAQELNSQNAEDLWAIRKKLFFKPKRSFGAKQSFKGASISRKAFDEISNQNLLAQEFIPAPEHVFQTPDGDLKFKYDLRFYVYQDRVQSVVARLYQGQVTNLRTTHGGFAPVRFLPI
jgi:hypothetical protein